METLTFHVRGMHCKSCASLIETELSKFVEVKKVRASLSDAEVAVTGDFGGRAPGEVATLLARAIAPHGYALSAERVRPTVKWSEFKWAAPIALGFAALFVILQKVGLVDLVNADSTSYGTAFLIGVIASVSTCMAVVGGLVLSLSATFAKKGDRATPQLLFHAGRLASFFVLGGVIGSVGSAFTLGPTGTFVTGLLVAIVMVVLGLNLLDVFPWAKRLMPSMPRFMSERAEGLSKLNGSLTPLLAGVATFFLPCGFTQSMQLYTLSTGSFLAGGLTMLSFALGTLPVLALVSFSSLSVKDSPKAGIFFKSAGLVVLMFALLNVLTGLSAIGAIPPILNL